MGGRASTTWPLTATRRQQDTRREDRGPCLSRVRGLGDGDDDDEKIGDDDDDDSRRGCVCVCVVKGDVMRCDATRLYTLCAECMYSDEQEKQEQW